MVEEKDIYIQYIQSEVNPSYIVTKNTSEADLTMHAKMITEGELWELVDTGRENFRKTGVRDYVITHDTAEYYSHATTTN